ncbi:hypothetical protein HC891_15865 [Candidatus Gracilibacteria bacterium]|nr:hypothetical protein [Candidatus Gracilibacteria bacterium]
MRRDDLRHPPLAACDVRVLIAQIHLMAAQRLVQEPQRLPPMSLRQAQHPEMAQGIRSAAAAVPASANVLQ